MKTPRELLLNRRRDAEPQLDAVRAKALAEIAASSNRSPGLGAMFVREWIAPCRRLWQGLGVAWAFVLIANAAMNAGEETRQRAVAAPSAEYRELLEEQRRLYAELLDLPPEPASEPATKEEIEKRSDLRSQRRLA